MPGEGKAVCAEGRIRRLRVEDAAELVAIAASARGAAEWSVQGYEKLCRSAEYVSFAHEAQGQITGFILGRRFAGEAEVLNLAVRPENRRNGIGGGLLHAVVEELRRVGVARIFLEVREGNKEARSFYQNRGFSVSGVRPKYYREPDEAAVLMERILTGQD